MVRGVVSCYHAAMERSGRPAGPFSLLRFWAPLALIWLIMGVEQPTIGAVVSRLPDAAPSLAAFEVAFGLAALIHSPVLQLLSAGTALVVDRGALWRVLKLFLIITGALTALHLLIGVTGVFDQVARHVIGVPEAIIAPARRAFLVLTPITAAVGLRRLLQGAMVRAGTTGSITVVILVRLAATTTFLLLILGMHRLAGLHVAAGGTVAALAFTIGVVSGAVAAVVIFRRSLVETLPQGDAGPRPLRSAARFYFPLALTGVVMTIGRPLLLFGMGRAGQSDLSIAAWPLIVGLLTIFQVLGVSYQEVAVARLSEAPGDRGRVRRAATVIGASLTLLAGATFLTPLGGAWFRVVVSAPPELLPLIADALVIAVPLPWIFTRIALHNGMLIAAGRTHWVTAGMAARILGYVVLGVSLPAATSMSGAMVAATTLLTAGTVQLAVLVAGSRRAGPCYTDPARSSGD